ncbi:MAG: D-alanyl-D-alanine carboxypeptidase [Bauldia sp.]|nr:D-alanyl-D-alanine carboxypeptidase [Bauldia sp.]
MTARFGRLLAAALAIVLLLAAPARAFDPPYLILDMDTGDVLAQRDAGELWYPASLTKLMTVYIVFQALRDGRLGLDSPITMTAAATAEPPARMGFSEGTVITVDNALKILMVKSANDVAVAVAENIAGSVTAFVSEMNRQAAFLGLSGTRFVNPHGLPASGQSTTARDMAMLGLALWQQFPEYRSYFGISAIQYRETVMPTPNALLDFYRGANGMKTGYICSAGYNLVATATRAGHTLLVTLLGESSIESRAITAAQLFDGGFGLLATSPRIPISGFAPVSSVTAPVDRRPEICPPGAPPDGEIADERVLTAAIGPRLGLTSPVVVATGGANMDRPILSNVPLPRAKPPLPPDALGLATAPPAATGVPLPRPRPGV